MKARFSQLLDPRLRWKRRAAIKEGMDNLPYGICFAYASGIVILCNRTMESLAHKLEGHALQDGASFWNCVQKQGIALDLNTWLLDLQDKGVWLISRTKRQLENRPVYAMEAQDVTEICQLNERLEQNNQRLGELAVRLRQYSLDVQDLTRQRELLERKAHTHDEMGRLLTETRHYLSGGSVDLDSLLPRWKLNASLLKEEAHAAEVQDVLGQLQQVARSIGIEMTLNGTFPRSGKICELILAAGAESLTNLVNHGQGTNLTIHSLMEDNGYQVRFSNNGRLPEGPVREGGGLGTLRRKVEDAGGWMAVECQPEFALVLWLPERKEVHVQNSDCR